MIKEAIDRLVELVRQTDNRENLTAFLTAEYDGVETTYLHKIEATAAGPMMGGAFQPFRPAKLEVTTLTGFLDAIKASVGGTENILPTSRLVHVEDFLTVSLKTINTDKFGVRSTLIQAKYTPPGTFEFDQFQTPEKFLIALETSFLRLDGDDTEYVKKLASNLKAGDTVHAQDDGVNQAVTLKIGQVESVEHAVKARVKLTPIRTFTEAAPCENEFLIRFKPSPGGLPMICLYNINGLKWQSEAVLSIKHYLEKNLEPKGLPILA